MTERLTDQEIEELRRLAEAAMPGPTPDQHTQEGN